MKAVYVDLHIHTSENADELNNNYNIDELIKKLKEKSSGRRILISLTDHNVINKDAYLKMIKRTIEENSINIILGTELHIRTHDDRPAYHCHIYFDIEEISEEKIDKINEILDELHPKKWLNEEISQYLRLKKL